MKKSYRFIFVIVLFFFLIYFLANINFHEIYILFTQANMLFFIPAFLAYSFSFLIFNLRTTYSLSWIVKPDYWFFLKVSLAGFFINTVTPGAQIGGEPVKAYFLSKKYKKPKTKLFAAIVGDRLFHTTVSLFFIISSILFILTFIPVSRELKIIFETFLFFVFLISILIFFLNLKKKKFNLKLLYKKYAWMIPFKNIFSNKFKRELNKHIGDFNDSFKKTIIKRKIIFLGITLSLTYWLLNYLVSYFLFLSFGVKVSFFLVIVVVSLGSLIGDFSPTPGGIGLVEGFMVFLYSILGINFALALTVSLLTRMIFYFHALLIGGISLIHLENSFR